MCSSSPFPPVPPNPSIPNYRRGDPRWFTQILLTPACFVVIMDSTDSS